MQNLINLETYFNVQNIYDEIGHFYLDFVLAGLCAYVISVIYEKYGRSISNRKLFGANFIILALTTMLIISIVKSSLALSLGLVGALSIVRFRSAIKEPEELTFLFLTMSVGLGFGSGQRMVTLMAFFGISLFLVVRGMVQRNFAPEYNMLLNISSKKINEAELDKVTESVKKFANFVNLKRLDTSSDQVEMLLYVKFDSIKNLNDAADSLKSLDSNLKMSFIEDKGLFA